MFKTDVDFELEVAELLVCSGFVLPYDLDRAYANRRGGPGLREALLEAGAVSESIWASAEGVIKQTRQTRIPKSQARTALYMVGNTSMSIDEALTKMGYTTAPATNPWANQLSALSRTWGAAS